MATFGYTNFTGSGGGTALGHNALMRVTKVTLPDDGDVSKITCYVTCSANPAITHGEAKCVIFDDDANYPGALVATTQKSGWTKAGDGAHPHDFTFAAPEGLTAGVYWLGCVGRTGGVYAGMYYLNDANGRTGYSKAGIATTWYDDDGEPDPYPGGAFEWNSNVLIYGTYTATGINITPAAMALLLNVLTATVPDNIVFANVLTLSLALPAATIFNGQDLTPAVLNVLSQVLSPAVSGFVFQKIAAMELDGHKLRIHVKGTTFGLPLVEITGAGASKIRIYTGVKTMALMELP